MIPGTDVAVLLHAAAFAADRHRDQRRKGAGGEPYINHPLAVAHLLADTGRIADVQVLAAALLHDTVEDTDTTTDELAAIFGPDIAAIVAEVTDDKSLPKSERKRLQIEHAPHLSLPGKLVKLADKLCNIQDVIHRPPDWPLSRRREYLEWAAAVVAGCRGSNGALEHTFDLTLAEGLRRLGSP